MERTVQSAWGEKARLVSWKSADEDDKGAQWASDLRRGKLTVEVPVVIKFQPPNVLRREALMSNEQFHNEVLVYQSILPIIGASHFAPRMHYGHASLGKSPEDDTVILELVNDYKPLKQTYLDEAHLISALKTMAEFHSCSYKEKDVLLPFAKKLKPVDFTTKPPEVYVGWMVPMWMRGINPVLDKYPVLQELVQIVKNDLAKIVRFLERGEEPTKVLCHGDFCGNNILFNENLDVKLVDFQRSTYSSPAIDVFFFLLLNCSPETRESSWDKLIETYLDNLSGAPPRDVMLAELSKRALYGYLHTSFFLPVMITGDAGAFADEEHYMNLPPEEMGRQLCQIGGDEVTNLLASSVEFLAQRGYIRSLLDSLK